MAGTVSSFGSRIYVAGTSSGIDTAALIEAAVAQKTAKAESLQLEVDENSAVIAAYDELLALTSNFEAAMAELRGDTSLFDTTERVWDLRAGTVSTSDGSDFSSIASIAIDSAAETGTYNFEVTAVAQAQKVASNTTTDVDSALGYDGVFSLGLLGEGSDSVTVTAGMSMRDVATAINDMSATTGVTASIIQVSETEYRMVLTANQTAREITTSSTSGDDVLNLIGVTDGVGGYTNTLQIAQSATLIYDGVTITRDDNNFDDLIAGVDIDVKNAAIGTTISLEVGNDTASVKEAITNFVDAYNEIRDFIVTNQTVSSDGAVSDDAVLFSDNLLDGLNAMMQTVLGSSFGNGNSIETIRDMGISIGENNKLEIDETVLDETILNNFDDLQAAFATSAVSDNDEFALSRNSSYTTSMSMVFDITTDGAGTITGVTVDGDGSAFTISGNTVIGAEGTVYEGLTFAYVGTEASLTINVDLNQGLADRLINSMTGYTDSVTGLITQEKLALSEQNTDKLAEANDIIERAESYQEKLIEKYADLETKIAALEVLKSQILAILGNTSDDE